MTQHHDDTLHEERRTEVGAEAAEHILGPNPVVGVHGKDILQTFGSLARQALRQPHEVFAHGFTFAAKASRILDGQVDITSLLQLVGVLLGNGQASETDETAGDVDAVEVGMQIGKSIGSITKGEQLGRKCVQGDRAGGNQQRVVGEGGCSRHRAGFTDLAGPAGRPHCRARRPH